MSLCWCLVNILAMKCDQILCSTLGSVVPQAMFSKKVGLGSRVVKEEQAETRPSELDKEDDVKTDIVLRSTQKDLGYRDRG